MKYVCGIAGFVCPDLAKQFTEKIGVLTDTLSSIEAYYSAGQNSLDAFREARTFQCVLSEAQAENIFVGKCRGGLRAF